MWTPNGASTGEFQVLVSVIINLMRFTSVSCMEVRSVHTRELYGPLISSPPGYIFGSIIEACTKHQEKNKPTQGDPVQLSAHFLVGADLVPYEVHVKTLKSGRSYTNLHAEFFQEASLSSHPP